MMIFRTSHFHPFFATRSTALQHYPQFNSNSILPKKQPHKMQVLLLLFLFLNSLKTILNVRIIFFKDSLGG